MAAGKENRDESGAVFGVVAGTGKTTGAGIGEGMREMTGTAVEFSTTGDPVPRVRSKSSVPGTAPDAQPARIRKIISPPSLDQGKDDLRIVAAI